MVIVQKLELMSFDAQCHRRFSHAFRMDEAVDDIVGEIEVRLHERAEKEISSLELGELVMEHLQKLDQVAYVRFASVYRQFKDIAQFMDEVKGLLKEGEKAKLPKPKTIARAK